MSEQQVLEVELEQRLERRDEALCVEASALRGDRLAVPDPRPIVGPGDRVAEDERPVGGEVERRLVASRLADRVGGDVGGELVAGLERLEAAVEARRLPTAGCPWIETAGFP